MEFQLNGSNLTVENFYHLMTNDKMKISIVPSAMEKVKKCRQSIEEMLEKKIVGYGVTTGFGSLKDKAVSVDQLATLQRNLILSHAVGTGNPLPLHRVRGMLALRINALIKGYSGVTVELIERLVEFFNLGIFSKVFEQGSVGASGDLAPLSHLMLGYLGEGELISPDHPNYAPAKEVLSHYRLTPLELKAKEGLACNNGTTFMTTHLAEAIHLSKKIIDTANIASGLTLEALRGTNRAFDSRIHDVRNQDGQKAVAQMMRHLVGGHGDQSNSSFSNSMSSANLTESSERMDCKNLLDAADYSSVSQTKSSERMDPKNLQDAYSLRCIPQVHGSVLDTINFAEKLVVNELNAATDNPLIFDSEILSGGNFHGQYPATTADFLAISLTTLGNISERRVERLVNGSLSKLPSFLIKENPGLNSGCMIFQYVAAALTAENRCLSTPSSVQSLPTCENQEDHVSMGAYCVRKLLQIVNNVAHILAIELYCASHAHTFLSLKTTPVLEDILIRVRKYAKPIENDRYMQPEVEDVRKGLLRGEFLLHRH